MALDKAFADMLASAMQSPFWAWYSKHLKDSLSLKQRELAGLELGEDTLVKAAKLQAEVKQLERLIAYPTNTLSAMALQQEVETVSSKENSIYLPQPNREVAPDQSAVGAVNPMTR